MSFYYLIIDYFFDIHRKRIENPAINKILSLFKGSSLMNISFKSLCFMSVFTASVFTTVVPVSLSLSAQAHSGSHATQSQTKTVGGLRCKLTLPKPLRVGKQKWTLHVSGSEAALQGLSFEGIVMMGDGMKNKVKVTPQKKRVFELSTELSMSGDWELILTKNKPAKASTKFELTVMGNTHDHAM